MSGIEDMVHAAEASLGLGESPPGSNQNYITSWYGLTGPWCDMSVSYWGAHSGNGDAIGRFGYTVAHAQWFLNRGQWHGDVAGIRRGDVVFFDWNFSNNIGAIDHVGLVTNVSGGTVYTIEGNISNMCLRKVRGSDVIVGYGRPAYVNAAPAPAPVPVPKPVPKPVPAPTPPPRYVPYPGASFFIGGQKSPIIGRMHDRLVAEGCNHYRTSQDKDTWGTGDKASYSAWQVKLGYRGWDANGIPGPSSWNALKVPA